MKNIKINYIAGFVLIVYPLIICFLGLLYWNKFGISTFEIVCVIASFYTFCISVGVGIHRLWAHGSYKTNKFIELILAVVSAGTFQGPVLAWVSDHDKHHSYTDVLGKDPHTPLKYCLLEENKNEYSTKGKLKGFFWSHMGWMLDGREPRKQIERSALKRLGKNKIVMWQFKNYWNIAILVNTLVPFCIGYGIGGSLQYAMAGFIFIGVGRAIQQQATFCINSVVHFFGSKEYTNGTAGDIPALFFMFLGENWHNFHHAFPRDYRNGHKWYQLDVHKWIIVLMEKLGLVSNVIRTPNERIKAKVELTKQQFTINMKKQLNDIETMFTKFVETLTKEIDEHINQVSVNVNNRLIKLKQKALFLGKRIEYLTNNSNEIKQKEIEKILVKLRQLEFDFGKYVSYNA